MELHAQSSKHVVALERHLYRVTSIMASLANITINKNISAALGVNKSAPWLTGCNDYRTPNFSKSGIETIAELTDLRVSKIHGREPEILLLQQAYKNNQRDYPGLVVIEGESGTGKSFLVSRVLDELTKDRKINYMYGKFDLQRRVEPYSAITAAFNDLSRKIVLQEDEEQLNSLRSMLKTELGGQEKVLTGWNPNLEPLFHKETNSESGAPSENNLGLVEERNRLLFLLRKFIRVICQFYAPALILFLDDLQWADTASLDVLESLTTDRHNKNLLVIGTERKHDREEIGTIMKNIQALGVSVEVIKLRDLNCSDLNNLLSDALRSEADHTAKLAEIVYRKTHGNPFFVMQFLHSLKDKKILTFNLSLVQWQWDDKLADELMHVTDNVSDLLRKMLLTLDLSEKLVLKVAACLGSRFCLPTLLIGMKSLQAVEHTLDVTNEADIVSTIESLISMGLLERLTTTDPQFRFVHDQILSSCYQLIPSERKGFWNLTIGEALLEMDQEGSDAGYLFLTTDLCNGGLSLIGNDVNKRDRIYHLNYRSGKKVSRHPSIRLVYFARYSLLIS
jgi:predicted ATPase